MKFGVYNFLIGIFVQFLLGCGLDGELNRSLTSIVAPQMTSSNSINNGYAKGGDFIYLDFQATSGVPPPTVTIAGYSATVSDLGSAMMRAEVSVTGSESNGFATYRISYSNSIAALDTVQGSVMIKNFVTPPTAVSLEVALDEIDVSETPTLKIEGLEAGATVRLYSDQCITQVGATLAVNSEMNVTSDVVPRGRHEFYAQQTDLIGNISDCSVVFQKYRKVGTPFVSIWRTTAPSQTITLPVNFSLVDFTVDWGDGSSSEITSSSDPDKSHTYAVAGDYSVVWRGEASNHICFVLNNCYSPQAYLLSIPELGDMNWQGMDSFASGTILTDVTGGNFSTVKSLNGMFFDNPFINPNTSSWDTSNVESMLQVFDEADVANPDVSNWDTSKVKTMRNMFRAAFLAAPDTSSWNTGKVEDMGWMFLAASIANPDTSGWDTSSAINMSRMFQSAPLANPSTGAWDTSNVTDMSFMFADATSANPDFASWNLANVTDMTGMFQNITLPTASYSNFLIKAEAQSSQVGVVLDGGNSEYNIAGGVAKAALIADHGWVITDGGPE